MKQRNGNKNDLSGKNDFEWLKRKYGVDLSPLGQDVKYNNLPPIVDEYIFSS